MPFEFPTPLAIVKESHTIRKGVFRQLYTDAWSRDHGKAIIWKHNFDAGK